MTLDVLSQIAIPLLGILSLVLVARKNKWGFVAGLATEPFWFMTSYFNHQWGTLILSFVYTFSWSYGIYKWFKTGK